MSPAMKTRLAEMLVATSWVWVPSVPLTLYFLNEGVAFIWLALAIALGLLFSRRLREYLFTSRHGHRALPFILGFNGATVGRLLGFDDGPTFFATLAAFGGGWGLAMLVWDTDLAPSSDEPGADPNYLRGGRLTNFVTVLKRAAASLRPGEDSFAFGPLLLALSLAVKNVIIFGAPGSGKTMLLLLALKSVLPGIKPGSRKRALIYDAKADMLSRLEPLGCTAPVVVANFCDARCSEWVLGRDFTDAPSIAEASELIFPIPQTGDRTNQFFDYAARDLLSGVMTSLNTRIPGIWTLRDVINAMESEERLRHVLAWDTPQNYSRLKLYFRNPELLQNILATLASKLEPYRVIASYMNNSPHSFSLREWLEEESVLLLGRPTESQTAADNLNSLLMARLVQLLLDRPNSDTPNTYVFLDEVSRAGKLRHLDMLLLMGRAKGTMVWLGAQSIGSLRAIYGPDITGDIVAGCGNFAALALADPDTAEYCEKLFGVQERWEKHVSHARTHSPHGGSYTFSESYSITRKPCVLASEFLGIAPPNRVTRAPLSGFFKVPGLAGSFQASISIEELEREIPDTGSRGAGTEEDFVPAPATHGRHARWTDDELRVLGLATESSGLGAPPREEDGNDESPLKPGKKPFKRVRPTLDNLRNPFKKGR